MIVLNYILYYFIIIPISLLPFGGLYALSDVLFLFFYYILGYRKKIILGNIQRSFPEKTKEEQLIICRKFYRHFCDLIVESLKMFTISEKEIFKRMTCKNPEVINQFYDQKRSVIVAGGHYNNWEIFAIAVNSLIKHKAMGIYKPLSNTFFDKKMQQTRSKYGIALVATNTVKKVFEKNRDQLTATIFAIDQSPGNIKKVYWMTFLNQETAVLFGTEKYAKEYNYPVIYGRINKEKRGYYSLEFLEVTAEPSQLPHGKITEQVNQLLEKDIRTHPEYWLWSHRRWKHKRPNPHI